MYSLPVLNQSILKEISPGVSLEGMMLKLKLQYFHWLCRPQQTMENSSKDGNTGVTYLPFCETCMQVRKQQLEPDMEQQTGSK